MIHEQRKLAVNRDEHELCFKFNNMKVGWRQRFRFSCGERRTVAGKYPEGITSFSPALTR
jgi:hypothetical protein